MAIPLGLHVLMVIIFAFMLFISIQQILIESWRKTDYMIYRVILALTIINENIISVM